MLTEPTLEKMRQMKLNGMLKAFEEQLNGKSYSNLSFESRLAHLIEQESLDRENRKLESRLKNAKLKHNACIENLSFKSGRKLEKTTVLSLAQSTWIKEHRNILITGLTGVGKSFLACALAHSACLKGFSSLYYRVPKLLTNLSVARGDGRYQKVMESLSKIDLLILDDWGLSKLNEVERRDFLEIIEERHELKSTIVTSQVPVKHWHELIGDSTIADALLDRLVHNSYRIELEGESIRKEKNEIKTDKKTQVK
jgi:DNA replication protein DnaC